jgi:UDP-glucose 4-epimerase
MKMIKSALIGSNGYLGSHLSHFLESEGFENHNFDLQESSVSDSPNYQQLDITQKKDFVKIAPDVDYIFMFSGLSGTVDGFDNYEKFFAVNQQGLLNLLLWMNQSGCKARVIFPSSRLVYKGQKDRFLREEDEKETRTIYAVNKLSAEHILWCYNNAFGINYTIFRICVPYGNILGNKYSYGTTGFMIDSALSRKKIELFGDGSSRRTFTHVEDVCINIIQAAKIETSNNKIFNIGGENLSLLEAAQMISKMLGARVSFIPWPEMAERVESGDTIFDDTKLKSIGFAEYKHNFKDFVQSLQNLK